MKKQEEKKDKEYYNNKYHLRLAVIICSTFIAIFCLIGIFWGREGFVNIGVVAGIISVIAILGAGTSYKYG